MHKLHLLFYLNYKIAQRQNSVKKKIISTGVFTTINLIKSSVMLLLLPLHTHFLAPEEYGIVVTMSAVTTFFLAFNGLGIKGASLRFLADTKAFDDNEYMQRLLSTLFTCAVLFSIAFCFVAALLLYGISFTASWQPWFYYGIFAILQATLMSPIFMYSEYLRVHLKNKKFLTLHINIITLIILSNLLFVAGLKLGVLGVFLSVLLSYSVGILLCIYWLIKDNYKFDKALVKPLTIFGLNMLPHVIFSTLLPIVDRYIIVALEGLEKVSFYTVINSLCAVLYTIAVNIGITVRSVIYRYIEEGKYKDVHKLLQNCSAGLSVIAALWIIWAQEIIMMLLPSSYYVSYDFVTILSLRFLLHIGPTFYLAGILYHEGGNRKVSKLSFISLITIIVLGYIFTTLYGVMGMALAGAISAFTYLVLCCYQAKKINNQTNWSIMHSIAPMLFIYAPIALFIYLQGWQEDVNIYSILTKGLLSLIPIGLGYLILKYNSNKSREQKVV
ncbi:MAG: O-antigen/teichoic acid export membrane protein [Alphaproteobacteria bacterium]|jgi:O-antigen/teichoic acid export membrane protein